MLTVLLFYRKSSKQFFTQNNIVFKLVGLQKKKKDLISTQRCFFCILQHMLYSILDKNRLQYLKFLNSSV